MARQLSRGIFYVPTFQYTALHPRGYIVMVWPRPCLGPRQRERQRRLFSCCHTNILIRMSATSAPIVSQPGTQQPPSLRESLQQLNNFLRSFPPDQLRETVWNMLYEALSSEGFDGRPSDDRSHILFFYSEITQLISHLVNIDRHMGDFAEGL